MVSTGAGSSGIYYFMSLIAKNYHHVIVKSLYVIIDDLLEYIIVNCVSPKRYAEVLTPSTSECDCIWRQGPYEDVIKVK